MDADYHLQQVSLVLGETVNDLQSLLQSADNKDEVSAVIKRAISSLTSKADLILQSEQSKPRTLPPVPQFASASRRMRMPAQLPHQITAGDRIKIQMKARVRNSITIGC